MIDEDYDVLFALIREEFVENKTLVKDLISKHLKNKERLIQIEDALPTLTIFVPQLPNNSFSAQSWDTDKVVPLVGIKSIKSNDIPILDAKGNEAILPAKYAPGFPVVVVKNSLRIMVDSNPEFNKINSKSTFTASNKKTYRYIHDNFDRKLNKRKNGRPYLDIQLESKIKDAYTIMNSNDNWHRDYIYYNLTPSTTSGPFSYEFKEAITSFRMSEVDPMGAYNLISDATDDPYVQPSSNNAQNTFWTGSSYSFRVHVVYNSKNGTGTEFTTLFSVAAHALWDVQYQAVQIPGNWPFTYDTVYFPTGVTPKYVDLREEIFNWDISAYATTVLVKFEEVDTQVNVQQTVSTTNTFANNFGLEGGEIFKKIGLKFGASATSQSLTSTQITFQEGSDELGTGSVNFADNIIINQSNVLGLTVYTTREYTCGYCRFIMRPVKVQ